MVAACLLALSASFAAAETPPVAPGAYTIDSNTTATFWPGPGAPPGPIAFQNTYYHVPNATRTVSSGIGSTFPVQLTLVYSQACYDMKLDENTNKCDLFCDANKPCSSPGAGPPNCKCSGATGLFSALPYTALVGNCGGSAGQLWSIVVPTTGGALGLHYCFAGTSPIYLVEQFTPGPGSESAAPSVPSSLMEHAAHRLSVHQQYAAATGSSGPTVRKITSYFTKVDVSAPPLSTFKPPAYCTVC